MDFELFSKKIQNVKVSVDVHIGTYCISVEEYHFDKTFEREYTLKGISLSKTLTAAGVSDTEALKTFMLENFSCENGTNKFAGFLRTHNIRYDQDGYTRYN